MRATSMISMPVPKIIGSLVAERRLKPRQVRVIGRDRVHLAQVHRARIGPAPVFGVAVCEAKIIAVPMP